MTLRLLWVTPEPVGPRSTARSEESKPFVSKVNPPSKLGAPETALLLMAPKTLAVKVMAPVEAGIQSVMAAEVFKVPPAKLR